MKSEGQVETGRGVMSRLAVITIEPMMLMYALATNVIAIPNEQLLLFKICLEKQFNVTEQYCRNFESNEEDATYKSIEQEVVNFNKLISVAENLIPVLLSFYIGSLSDTYGRKIFIAINMAGKTVADLFSLLNAIYLTSWNRWVWLATVETFRNLSGGWLVFLLITFAFIADNSSPESRTLRMGIFSTMTCLSRPLASALAGLLYGKGGYVYVFSFGFACQVLALIFGALRLFNFKENFAHKDDVKFRDLISPWHIYESIRCTFRKRLRNKRIYLCGLITVLLTMMVTETGELSFQFMLTKRMFDWEATTFAWYISIKNLIASLCMIILLVTFHYRNLNEFHIITVSCLSALAGSTIRMFAFQDWWIFYISAAADFAAQLHAPVRAEMTRCIDGEETGKIFAFLSSIESVVPIAASALYTSVYSYIVQHDFYPGLTYLISSISHLIGLGITIWIAVDLNFGTIPTDEEIEMEARLRNRKHPDESWKQQKSDSIYTLSYSKTNEDF